jgi:alanyl-tRNA synthetase
MDESEIERVEALANRVILQDAPVETKLMDRDQAIESGAMALFGEKYGDEVRVVAMGRSPEDEDTGKAWSVELCGGTHVGRTGEIGLVTVVNEGAVAAGVRRIEALTGETARLYLEEQEKRLKAAAATLKVRPEEVETRVAALVEERRRLERELAEAKKKLAMGGGGVAAGSGEMRKIAGINFLGRAVAGISPKDLKGLADDGKKQVGSGVVAFVGVSEDGKGAVVVGVTDDLTSRISAVDLVKKGAEAMGGKGGGGRPDLAQAGGPNGAQAQAALEAIEAALGSAA